MFKCIKLLVMMIILSVVVFATYETVLDEAGEYLYKKDQIKPADVIVVLGGEQTERVKFSSKLFKEGWARKDRVIMSGGPVVWKFTLAYLMKEHAKYLGVPARAIILEEKSESTEENAKYVKEILLKRGYKSIILVTSPYHSKRSYIIFQKVMGDEIEIISVPVPVEDSWLSLHGWWKKRLDRSRVLSEYAKFTWLWLFGVKN